MADVHEIHCICFRRNMVSQNIVITEEVLYTSVTASYRRVRNAFKQFYYERISANPILNFHQKPLI